MNCGFCFPMCSKTPGSLSVCWVCCPACHGGPGRSLDCGVCYPVTLCSEELLRCLQAQLSFSLCAVDLLGCQLPCLHEISWDTSGYVINFPEWISLDASRCGVCLGADQLALCPSRKDRGEWNCVCVCVCKVIVWWWVLSPLGSQ